MISKFERRFILEILPSIILPLIRSGHLTAEHLLEPAVARKIVARRTRFAIKRMQWCVAPEIGFSQSADKLWKQNDKTEAIVLLAVALEQCVNSCLRLALEAKGNSSAHVTELIRTQNIDPKLTWFFELSSGVRFPKQLRKRTKQIFDIRNSIVHFKCVFAHPDTEEDSYSKVMKEIKSLGRFRLYSFYLGFQGFCWDVICRCDPEIKLAVELSSVLLVPKQPAKLDASHRQRLPRLLLEVQNGKMKIVK